MKRFIVKLRNEGTMGRTYTQLPPDKVTLAHRALLAGVLYQAMTDLQSPDEAEVVAALDFLESNELPIRPPVSRHAPISQYKEHTRERRRRAA